MTKRQWQVIICVISTVVILAIGVYTHQIDVNTALSVFYDNVPNMGEVTP